MFFAGGNEAVKGEGIFTDMSVNEKSDFGMQFSESGIRGERNLDYIAYAANID
jgi:hypothetical protein